MQAETSTTLAHLHDRVEETTLALERPRASIAPRGARGLIAEIDEMRVCSLRVTRQR
jgi:hypothetical protein